MPTDDRTPPDSATTDMVESVHDHLAATAELPVDPTASTYLGEAEAVAADALAATRSGQPEVVQARLEQVVELLAEIETTGHPAADDHVKAARRLAVEATET